MSVHDFAPFKASTVETTVCAHFDRYGTRLATGSADHRIRIYDLDPDTDTWTLLDVWRGHHAEVTEVK